MITAISFVCVVTFLMCCYAWHKVGKLIDQVNVLTDYMNKQNRKQNDKQ